MITYVILAVGALVSLIAIHRITRALSAMIRSASH
jgi:hypothetical protein